MSKIAFIYPGQGAQKAGMGQDFYENSKSAKAVFDKASDILGLDMNALCFEENDKLDLTEYTSGACDDLSCHDKGGKRKRYPSGCDSRIKSWRVLRDR